jgi:cellulose synthase/poly-beta-1,6-N-acetylglucosamine synthase-like glycosyltransferase
MSDPIVISLIVIFLLVIYPYAGYPVLLMIIGRIFGKPLNPPQANLQLPTCSIVIPVHNGAAVIGRKLTNILQLTYPKELLQIIVVCDGCSDATEQIVSEYTNSRIEVISLPRCGKNSALNTAVTQCRNEILVFSDCDSMLIPDALFHIVRWFEIPSVGGVVGRKRIIAQSDELSNAQQTYLSMQDRLRELESQLHSSATNEGKLNAIRRSLWKELPLQGCDDFLTLLNIISCKKRFIFEPLAIAEIPVPSKDMQGELERRRRIVKRSMIAQWHHRALFNPLRSGWFSFMLWSHKLGRRLSPFGIILFVILCMVQTIRITSAYYTPMIVIFLTITFLLFEMIILKRHKKPSSKTFTTSNPFMGKLLYFTIGNLGTIQGITDFLLRTGNAVYWVNSRYSDIDNTRTNA